MKFARLRVCEGSLTGGWKPPKAAKRHARGDGGRSIALSVFSAQLPSGMWRCGVEFAAPTGADRGISTDGRDADMMIFSPVNKLFWMWKGAVEPGNKPENRRNEPGN